MIFRDFFPSVFNSLWSHVYGVKTFITSSTLIFIFFPFQFCNFFQVYSCCPPVCYSMHTNHAINIRNLQVFKELIFDVRCISALIKLPKLLWKRNYFGGLWIHIAIAETLSTDYRGPSWGKPRVKTRFNRIAMETYFLLVVLFIQVNILFAMEPQRMSCHRDGNFNVKDVGEYLLGIFPYEFAKRLSNKQRLSNSKWIHEGKSGKFE